LIRNLPKPRLHMPGDIKFSNKYLLKLPIL
jgi:hypothetical protein